MKKPFPTPDDLIGIAYIFNSHEDFTVIEDLYAGFDDNLNLIILCEHNDSDHPEYNCATCAIVCEDEAIRLARRLKIPLNKLPLEICEAVSAWEEMVCPMPDDVVDCFKEITECLLDEGCRFSIRRKPSPIGYIAC